MEIPDLNLEKGDEYTEITNKLILKEKKTIISNVNEAGNQTFTL